MTENPYSQKEILDYLDRINARNQSDLDCHWVGDDDEGDLMIRVYSASDDLDLCTGTKAEIIELVRESLAFWGLEDA